MFTTYKEASLVRFGCHGVGEKIRYSLEFQEKNVKSIVGST